MLVMKNIVPCIGTTNYLISRIAHRIQIVKIIKITKMILIALIYTNFIINNKCNFLIATIVQKEIKSQKLFSG
jgi:hypothetical protein